MKELESVWGAVWVGSLSDGQLNELLSSDEFNNADKYILLDENTSQHCLPTLLDHVEALHTAHLLEIESGEESKTIEICAQLWGALSDNKASREIVVINLGGGVITDMGGFVASTYKRGVRFINVPTTLLAQVDASVGGKVGVDLDNLKNQIGSFSKAEAVFVDVEFLNTLPVAEFVSGYAEVIKHAFIRDKKYWEAILDGNIAVNGIREDIVCRSIEIKNQIVTNDPKEKGERKLLNFGHTIGHAVETWCLNNGSKVLHGYAVALGMICESYISNQITGLSAAELEEICAHIVEVFGKMDISEIPVSELIDLMKNDKKNRGTEINFTLLKQIGVGVYNNSVEEGLIAESLKFYNEIQVAVI